MTATELLALPYSPWSEKARWALDVRHVPYTYRYYSPLLGELELRRRLRRWSGKVSVPLLITQDGKAISDSAAIARWAAQQGEGPELFPAQHEAAITRFVELSEQGLNAGRALALARVVAEDEAVRELVPRGMRKLLGPFATTVGRLGVQRTLRKYGGTRLDAQAFKRQLCDVLDSLRASLASGDGNTLLGHLTFADIAMAQVLAFISPPAKGLRISQANRRNFGDLELAARYADLVRWRDSLYLAYRE